MLLARILYFCYQLAALCRLVPGPSGLMVSFLVKAWSLFWPKTLGGEPKPVLPHLLPPPPSGGVHARAEGGGVQGRRGRRPAGRAERSTRPLPRSKPVPLSRCAVLHVLCVLLSRTASAQSRQHATSQASAQLCRSSHLSRFCAPAPPSPISSTPTSHPVPPPHRRGVSGAGRALGRPLRPGAAGPSHCKRATGLTGCCQGRLPAAGPPGDTVLGIQGGDALRDSARGV